MGAALSAVKHTSLPRRTAPLTLSPVCVTQKRAPKQATPHLPSPQFISPPTLHSIPFCKHSLSSQNHIYKKKIHINVYLPKIMIFISNEDSHLLESQIPFELGPLASGVPCCHLCVHGLTRSSPRSSSPAGRSGTCSGG